MLLEELKSVILQLDNSNRFHTINGKRDTWLYDSYAHKIYRIDTKIINGIKRDNTNALENSSLENNLEFLLFCKSIKNVSQDFVEPIPPSKKCTVMINTSNRCNLNCSYCYRHKTEPSVSNLTTIKNTLDFVMKKYKPYAEEFVISYSMTSESSLDLPILKQIADEYINFENYQFTESDINDSSFKEFYNRLQTDLKACEFFDFPAENKNQVVKFLNSVLSIRNLFDILKLSESMFNENDRSEIRKRFILAKWRLFRLNRWCLEILYDKYIHKRKVPFVGFWFMTNGTCASKEFIDFVKSCDINPLWISLDGPKKVHDSNRKYNLGNGSYDDIIKNIKFFYTNGINLKASAVLTANFPRPLKIIKHLLSLGFKEISLTPVRPGYEYSFSESNVKDLLAGYDEIFALLKASAKKNDFSFFHLLKEDMCLAAFYSFFRKIKLIKRCSFDDQIVVDSKGDIYPCLYFTGNKNFCYGNISNRIERNRINHKIYVTDREDCKNCWARYLCGGTCFYASYTTTGSTLPPDPIECTIRKHLAERCLELIVFLFENNIAINRIIY